MHLGSPVGVDVVLLSVHYLEKSEHDALVRDGVEVVEPVHSDKFAVVVPAKLVRARPRCGIGRLFAGGKSGDDGAGGVANFSPLSARLDIRENALPPSSPKSDFFFENPEARQAPDSAAVARRNCRKYFTRAQAYPFVRLRFETM